MQLELKTLKKLLHLRDEQVKAQKELNLKKKKKNGINQKFKKC